jgi:hypothetical protein
MAVLAATTGLARVLQVDLLDLLLDHLAVGDLRPSDVGLDLELTQEPVDDDLEVQLALAADQGLTGLLVGVDLEGRVLLGELLQRVESFSWSVLVLGSIAMWMTGRGNSIDSSRIGASEVVIVSPVLVSFRPTRATMSPVMQPAISSR